MLSHDWLKKSKKWWTFKYRSFDLEKANLSYDPPALRALPGGNPLTKCAHWSGGGGGGGDSGRLPFMQSKNACDNDVDYNVARPVLRVTIVEDVVG